MNSRRKKPRIAGRKGGLARAMNRAEGDGGEQREHRRIAADGEPGL